MDSIKKNELLFYILTDTVQQEALEKIGRALTEDELQIARKGLESGIMTGIDIIYNTIFNEMIKI